MSLSDTITLGTDTAAVVFDRISDAYADGKAKSLYLDKGRHVSVSAPFSLEFTTVQPKTNGDSLGVFRPETKIRLACPVLNAKGETVTKVLVLTVTASVPVGFPPAVEAEARYLIGEWIKTTNTMYDDFVKFCEV